MSYPIDDVDFDRFIPAHLVEGGDPYEEHAPVMVGEPAGDAVVVPEVGVSEEERVRRALASVTSKGLHGMSRADRIAALKAIASAIDEQVKEDISFLTDQFQGATKAQPIYTALGKLSYNPGSAKAVPDEAKLLAYVKENYPGAVTTRTVEEIDPTVRAEILGSVIDAGDGDFVDGATGTVVDFMTVGKPSSPSVAYPASREQKIVKREAKRALEEQMIALTSGMLDAAKATPGLGS